MCRALSRGSDPQGLAGVYLAGGVQQFVRRGDIDPLGEAPIIIGVPASSVKVAHINSKPPIGDDVGKLDAVSVCAFPVGGMLVVQVDEGNPAVNLTEFSVRHLASHVMLEHHGVEDQRLGSGMPMKASVFLGVFDKALIDVVGELEV